MLVFGGRIRRRAQLAQEKNLCMVPMVLVKLAVARSPGGLIGRMRLHLPPFIGPSLHWLAAPLGWSVASPVRDPVVLQERAQKRAWEVG